MKSIKYTVLTIATLGVLASVFNIFYQGTFSLGGFNTLWPSVALFSILFVTDKKETKTLSSEEVKNK
jgi:hypothetical protein